MLEKNFKCIYNLEYFLTQYLLKLHVHLIKKFSDDYLVNMWSIYSAQKNVNFFTSYIINNTWYYVKILYEINIWLSRVS